jgi:magnesium and cobalt transporter
MEFPEGKFESVGGFVISLLGKVPGVDEKVVYQNIEMVVEAANNRKIEKLRVRRIAPLEDLAASDADQA